MVSTMRLVAEWARADKRGADACASVSLHMRLVLWLHRRGCRVRGRTRAFAYACARQASYARARTWRMGARMRARECARVCQCARGHRAPQRRAPCPSGLSAAG
eukprot:1586886-Pleurochrysis_carterae.AAC.1